MTRPWTGYLAGAAFALFATTGAVAYAQSAPAAAEKQADADAARAPKVERHEMRREERHIVIQDGDRHFEMSGGHHMDMGEHLRTMLQLKPGQEAALTAYLAATAPQHHERIVEMSDHAAPKTTPQRLAEMEARMAEDTARGKARIEATRRFYDQLEPSQKKVFDEMPMLMGPMMMHGDGMKVMVNLEGMPPMPPLPPLPPRPSRAPVPPTPPAPHS
jgi:hypothetical protein